MIFVDVETVWHNFLHMISENNFGTYIPGGKDNYCETEGVVDLDPDS